MPKDFHFPSYELSPAEFKKQKHDFYAEQNRQLETEIFKQLASKNKKALFRPRGWSKPGFNTPEYWKAYSDGWISEPETKADHAAYQPRRDRSLRTAWRYSLNHRKRHDPPKDSKSFTPQMSSRSARDNNLTPMARILTQRLAELTYRDNREGRYMLTTASYLAKALGRSIRSIQRYLRELIEEGYIDVSVLKSNSTEMIIGLKIQLLSPLFAHHHKEKWPEKRRNPDATNASDKYSTKIKILEGAHINAQYSDLKLSELCTIINRGSWALKCMNGVRRSYERLRRDNKQDSLFSGTIECRQAASVF